MHLARAIGVEAIQKHGKQVRFFSIVELVNALEQEKAHCKADQIAPKPMYFDPVILDELGYLPFSQAGGALLFQLLFKLYERTSVVITTNGLCRKGAGLRRCQDGYGTSGPIDAPLSHRGDWQSELAV